MTFFGARGWGDESNRRSLVSHCDSDFHPRPDMSLSRFVCGMKPPLNSERPGGKGMVRSFTLDVPRQSLCSRASWIDRAFMSAHRRGYNVRRDKDGRQHF
jgi:hypothetical protein